MGNRLPEGMKDTAEFSWDFGVSRKPTINSCGAVLCREGRERPQTIYPDFRLIQMMEHYLVIFIPLSMFIC